MFRTFLVCYLFVFSLSSASAEKPAIHIGIATILSGDLAIVGENARNTTEAYKTTFGLDGIEISFEDSRLSSTEGLAAYQQLISRKKIDIGIAMGTSNGVMASVGLFNSSKTPVVMVSTGGSNIDQSSEFVFRIGNSDSLNGSEQAEYLIEKGLKSAAVLTEQTEYTQDITRFFVPEFTKSGGQLVFNKEFAPGTTDFRTFATLIRSAKPDAIFLPTQTGSALGVFLKQWELLRGDLDIPIFTTFVAAPNEDAHAIAGDLLNGVYYMQPTYSEENKRRKKLFETYRKLYKKEPALPFHSAGLSDTLDLIKLYMTTHATFDQESFRKYLLSVENYDGMLGTLTFDIDGNTSVGFRMEKIESK